MNISLIQYNSPSYLQMIELRRNVLRKPLGLDFTPEQLVEDEKNTLIGAFINDKLVGCCVLTPISSQQIQLRQMAVDPTLQGKGVGKLIVQFAENWAFSQHFFEIILHARENAIPFYEKLGYKKNGDPFIEVTIPHMIMIKNISK